MKQTLLSFATSFVAISLVAQTTVTLQPGAATGNDASLGSHTNYNTENNNYGTDPYIKAYCIPGAQGGQNTNRAVIEFDLASIPAGATIVSADLTLYATGYLTSTLTGHFGNNTATLSRITGAWTEGSVTWNTAPATTTQNQVTLAQSTNSTQDYASDVTALVQDMINNPASSFGFYFALVTENPSNAAALLFHSSDGGDPNKWPKLEIVYTTGNCIQPDPNAGNDASLGSHTNYNTENTNYGSNVYLNAYCIAGAQGGQNTNRALLSFNLTSIPTTAIVQSADLYLYGTGFINSMLPGHFGSNASSIECVTSSWSESAVTWNSAPTTTPTNAATLPQSTSANQDYIVSVTAMTQYQVANPSLNYGFLFRNIVENPSAPAGLLFWSSDHSDPNKRPKLCVTYNDSINPKSVHTIVLDALDMEVFPNPSTQFLTVNTGELSNAVINIYSTEGKLANSIQYQGLLSTYYIPVAELASGTYLVEILAEDKRGTTRFVKSE
jgi:hypothetical protein